MNVLRLMRIIADSKELSSAMTFNPVAKEFVFAGYNSYGRAPSFPPDSNAPLNALAKYNGGAEAALAPPSAKHTLVQLDELRQVVDSANTHFRQPSRRDALAKYTDDTNQMINMKTEADYWIPYSAFELASEFKRQYLPGQPVETFYPFLVSLNRVWRERTKARVSAAGVDQRRRSSSTGAAKRPPSAAKGKVFADAIKQDLAGLRREAKAQRVVSGSTVKLLHAYDRVAEAALEQRYSAECALREAEARLSRTMSERAPHVRALESVLLTLIEDTRRSARVANSEVLMVCGDLRKVLREMELPHNYGELLNDAVKTIEGQIFEVHRMLQQSADHAEQLALRPAFELDENDIGDRRAGARKPAEYRTDRRASQDDDDGDRRGLCDDLPIRQDYDPSVDGVF